MKITFIGCGVMGEAILSAILDKGLNLPQEISISDINEARRRHLKQKYGVEVASSNPGALTGRDIIILAIKPQNLAKVMAELSGQLKPSQLVLSIIAGARINSLRLGLKHDCIVRAMPNTPAQIGEGISVWTPTAEVTKQQKIWAGSILGAMGTEIYIDDEKYIDMATAVSGSGPAYIFLFMEALIDAAVNIGLPRDMAQELVLHTVLGSGHFSQKSDKPLAVLRTMVTSPGGTTEAALHKLAEKDFSNLILQAVVAAYNRAQELGN
jgi:pyrroline-5-carboxylate reductase